MKKENKKAVSYLLGLIVLITIIIFTIKLRLLNHNHEGHDCHHHKIHRYE